MNGHVYVHVPYCLSICPYCDFLRDLPSRLPPGEDYVEALVRDLTAIPGRFETIYFGGGTPTELPVPAFSGLLEAFSPRLADGGEWTVEANPRSLTRQKMELMSSRGVNRVSLGTQSAEDLILAKLGRIHRHADTRAAVAGLRDAGISNISLDIIYGIEGENVERTLDAFLGLEPEHVSAYELTIEGHSLWNRSGIDPSIDPELKFETLTRIVDQLGKAGLERYEISNFARPGFESRHNLHVWRCGEFTALGAGGHGNETHGRYAVRSSIWRYVEAREIDRDEDENLFLDTLLCLMRLPRGVALDAIPPRNRAALEDASDRLELLREKGYIEWNGGFLRSTRLGLRYLNEAAVLVA